MPKEPSHISWRSIHVLACRPLPHSHSHSHLHFSAPFLTPTQYALLFATRRMAECRRETHTHARSPPSKLHKELNVPWRRALTRRFGWFSRSTPTSRAAINHNPGRQAGPCLHGPWTIGDGSFLSFLPTKVDRPVPGRTPGWRPIPRSPNSHSPRG